MVRGIKKDLPDEGSALGSPFGGAGTASAVTERALSAPCGGTSPIGRGKAHCGAILNQIKPPFTYQPPLSNFMEGNIHYGKENLHCH